MDSILAFKKYKLIRDQILNISDIFYDYPEEVRPEKPLEFEDVLAISAKEGAEDIDLVKSRVRQTLDVHAELEREAELQKGAELMGNIKENLRERGPQLV